MTKKDITIPFLAIIAGIIVGMSCMAHSADYYINGSTGHDTNYDGTSPTVDGGGVGPWASLSKATSTLTAGQVVEVAGGTYVGDSNRISETTSGSDGLPITYQGASGETVILDGSTMSGSPVYLNGASWITVKNFTINDSAIQGVAMAGDISGIVLEDLHIDNPKNAGIHCDLAGSVSDLTVTDVNIVDQNSTGNTGALYFNDCNTITFTRVTITNPARDGFWGYGNSDVTFDSCYIEGQQENPDHQDAIQIGDCNGLVIKNCILHSTSQNIYFGVNNTLYDQSEERDVYIYGNTIYNEYWFDFNEYGSQGIIFSEATAVTGAEDTDVNGMYIFNNTILYCGFNAILVQPSESPRDNDANNIVIMNNIIVDSPSTLDGGDQDDKIHSDWNWYWTSGTGQTGSGLPGQATSATATAPALEDANSTSGTSPQFTNYNATTYNWTVATYTGDNIENQGCGLAALQAKIPGISSWTDRSGNTHDGSEPGAYAYSAGEAPSTRQWLLMRDNR